MALRVAILLIVLVASLLVSLILIDYFQTAFSPIPGGVFSYSIIISDRTSWSIGYSFVLKNRDSAEFLTKALPITVFVELIVAQLALAFGIYRLGRFVWSRRTHQLAGASSATQSPA